MMPDDPHTPPPVAPPHVAMGPGVEFDTIRGLLARWGPLAQQLGDDAALLAPTAGYRVVSTDACVEQVHFWRSWLTPQEVGARAAAAALSDLAAMGASAESVLVSFVVPDDWRHDLGAVADGIAGPVRDAGAVIVGGNLSRGATFSVTLTVIGQARRPVTRAGARVGDFVVVTGVLGGPGRALGALLAGQSPEPWARARFAGPVPRLAEGQWLAAAGATAMLDISDGLAADARHLEAAGNVALVIDDARIPCGPGCTAADALASGEEYELLATLPADALERLRAQWPAGHPVPFTVIGEVRAAAHHEAAHREAAHPGARDTTRPAGHDHFGSP